MIIGIIGILATVIALIKTDIIELLLGAYSIYSPGIVFPLFFAIYFYNKRQINKKLWYTAVVTGSICGIINSYFLVGGKYLPLLGMGISLVLSVLSILQTPDRKCNI